MSEDLLYDEVVRDLMYGRQQHCTSLTITDFIDFWLWNR